MNEIFICDDADTMTNAWITSSYMLEFTSCCYDQYRKCYILRKPGFSPRTGNIEVVVSICRTGLGTQLTQSFSVITKPSFPDINNGAKYFCPNLCWPTFAT